MIGKKRMLMIGLAAAAVGIAATALMAWKDRTYVPSPAYSPVGLPNPDAAVVYYSRSGHSEAVAREIARAYNAPVARITANYELGFSGQRKAISDARASELPSITVESLPSQSARRLFLVSPTWMFRPAPPLWAYVEQANLIGKDVVLVMTGNSRFEQTEIDAFAARVEARGGRLVHHVFLRRGRVFWQKSRHELLSAARSEAKKIRDSDPAGALRNNVTDD